MKFLEAQMVGAPASQQGLWVRIPLRGICAGIPLAQNLFHDLSQSLYRTGQLVADLLGIGLSGWNRKNNRGERNVISPLTPQRIAALGTTIADAALELETALRELSVEADAQLAAAAEAFVAAHAPTVGGPPHERLMVDYVDARKTLVEAAIAASNIAERTERATTLRAKCDWWRDPQGRQISGDMSAVCSRHKHPGTLWIEANRDKLPPNTWLAVNADGIVAQDTNRDNVVARLRELGLDDTDVMFEFVNG